MDTDIETRAVGLAELKRGVKLNAGHCVRLVVGDATGTRKRGTLDVWSEHGVQEIPPGSAGGMSGGAFVIELQLHAAGGTPLPHERVRVVDPDTGHPVGEPAVTDENGIVRARVTEEKEYELHIVESGDGEEHPDAFDDHAHPLPAQLPHPAQHPVLHVQFLTA